MKTKHSRCINNHKWSVSDREERTWIHLPEVDKEKLVLIDSQYKIVTTKREIHTLFIQLKVILMTLTASALLELSISVLTCTFGAYCGGGKTNLGHPITHK